MPYPNVNGFALLNDHARRFNWSGSGKCMLLLMNTLLLAKNTLIRARFTAKVYVQARHTQVVVEVTERLPASHGLVECCTLAIRGQSQHVPTKVFNLSEETVRIHKNQSLAEFTEATTCTNATTGPPDVDKITTGDHLTHEQSRRLQHLLCKYQTVFAYDRNEGRTSTIEHTIKLTDDTLVASRYRRTPSGWKHEIEREVQGY